MKAMLALFAGLAASGSAVAQDAPATEAKVSRLTEPQDDYPDISPDGRHILFQSNRSGTWQVWRMQRDGTQIVRVTNNANNDRQPAWSPDGKLVAYSSDAGMPAGRRAIFIMPSPLAGATGTATRLTGGEGQDIHPKWLPDGSGLVFNRLHADGRQADVHIVSLDGRERPVPLGPGLNPYASVDPAGRHLIFRGTATETGAAGPVENSDIYAAAIDGSGRRRLTDDPAFDGWPAIAPDGRTIAFASRRGGDRFRLYLMAIDGAEPRLVPTPPGYHYTQPAWARDGRALAAYRWTQDAAGEVGQLVWVDLPPGPVAR